MKLLIPILLLWVSNISAQNVLNFNKGFLESENHWVAFIPQKDSSYPFGYVYIDPQAGLTLNYEGAFDISSNGDFVPRKKTETSSVKIRLQPSKTLVAFIPESKFKELKISANPEWLKFYQTDTNSIAHLYRWGYVYNEFGEYVKALNYLNRAEQINPTYKGLAVEMAFSYNALKEYDKSEKILEKEIKSNPSDAYVNKEYIYTLIHSNKINEAIGQYDLAKKTVSDKKYDLENCYNILGFFYRKKDKVNFDKWILIFNAQPTKNQIMTKDVEVMKNEMNK